MKDLEKMNTGELRRLGNDVSKLLKHRRAGITRTIDKLEDELELAAVLPQEPEPREVEVARKVLARRNDFLAAGIWEPGHPDHEELFQTVVEMGRGKSPGHIAMVIQTGVKALRKLDRRASHAGSGQARHSDRSQDW